MALVVLLALAAGALFLVGLTPDKSGSVYPDSIIGEGANSVDELQRAIAGDPVLADHYADFDLAKTKVVRLDQPKIAHVSYRVGNSVYWTRKPLVIPAGETVLSDGTHMALTRNGNQLQDATPNQADASGFGSASRSTAAMSSSAGPSALSGPSGLAAGTATAGGSGGFAGAPGAKTKTSAAASPIAGGSLEALDLHADQPQSGGLKQFASPGAAADFGSGAPTSPGATNSSSASPITAGNLGLPRHSDNLPPSPISAGSSGTPGFLVEPSAPFDIPGPPGSNPEFAPSGGALSLPSSVPNAPETASDTVGSTEVKTDPAHPEETATPPQQGGESEAATIPEPGTTLLMLGAVAAYATRRFRKDPAPRA
jgi:hypothetical protein